jgi:hypothetical protein
VLTVECAHLQKKKEAKKNDIADQVKKAEGN